MKKLVIEKFRKQDIIDFEEMRTAWDKPESELKTHVNVEYDVKSMEHIILPVSLFERLLTINKPEAFTHLPWKIMVKKLDRGDSPWLKNCGWLGYQNDKTNNFRCDLHLDPELKYPTVALLWLMMHEFRHKMQYEDKNIQSCIVNTNRDMFLGFFADPDMAMHVLHEIEPGESDANIFASEVLEIPYPGSKFEITEERLKLLKVKGAG